MVYVRDKCLNFDILTYCMLDFYIQRHKSGSKLENQKLFLVTGDITFTFQKETKHHFTNHLVVEGLEQHQFHVLIRNSVNLCILALY